MGFYHEQRPPNDDKPEKPGCLDAIVITRAVFQMLFWPVAAMILVVVDIGFIFYLFTVHPALALIPIAFTFGVVMLLIRWDQHRDHPGSLD